MNNNIFIFGFGYSAAVLAQKLIEQGYQVFGTSRNSDLRAANKVNPKLTDFNNQALKYLNQSSKVLISVPPHEDGFDAAFFHFSHAMIKNKKHIDWLGYLSTTGVYGDYQGDWVDEKMPCNNLSSARAMRRIKAENQWLSLYQNYGIASHIFRLAGIYGKNRNPLIRIKSGKTSSIYKKNHFFSRIHTLDIARFLIASIHNPTPGQIYNLADDTPAPLYEVETYAANLLNYPKPHLIPINEAKLSPMAKELYSNNRKISNQKIKSTLFLDLKFPSYKEGLTYEFNKLNHQIPQ